MGPGVAVQGRTRPDVGGDVGDGDPDHPALGITRIVVRLGEDGVVVVARILGIDCDEEKIAEVCATLQRRRSGGLRFCLGLFGKAGLDAVGVDGDQRGGAGVILAADHLDQLALFGAVASFSAGADGGDHQIAVAQFLAVVFGEHDAVLRTAIDRLDPEVASAARPLHLAHNT